MRRNIAVLNIEEEIGIRKTPADCLQIGGKKCQYATPSQLWPVQANCLLVFVAREESDLYREEYKVAFGKYIFTFKMYVHPDRSIYNTFLVV